MEAFAGRHFCLVAAIIGATFCDSVNLSLGMRVVDNVEDTAALLQTSAVRLQHATEAADATVEGAIQLAIKAFIGRLDANKCTRSWDVFDGFTNFMIFPNLAKQLHPSLNRFERRCGRELQKQAEEKLADADSFHDLSKASEKILYLHSFLGYGRNPLQAKLMDACRRIASSLYEEDDSPDVEKVLATVYGTRLFHNYGHGMHFSWSHENASHAIEEFTDLVIHLFDRTVTGLNMTECLGSYRQLPDVYGDFMTALRTKIRPYPNPEDMEPKVLYHALYFVTHLVYFFTGFGMETLSGTARLELEPERRFLKAALPMLSREDGARHHLLDEADLLGEVLYCHILLGEPDSDPQIRQKRVAIIAKQRQDGLFQSHDDDDDGLDHATYNALTALIPHSWFPDAANANQLSMITESAFDKLLGQASILRSTRSK